MLFILCECCWDPLCSCFKSWWFEVKIYVHNIFNSRFVFLITVQLFHVVSLGVQHAANEPWLVTFKIIIYKILVLVRLVTPVVTVVTENAVWHNRSQNSVGGRNFLCSYFVRNTTGGQQVFLFAMQPNKLPLVWQRNLSISQSIRNSMTAIHFHVSVLPAMFKANLLWKMLKMVVVCRCIF